MVSLSPAALAGSPTTYCNVATSTTTGEEILKQMQCVIDHKEGRPRATGGAIVPKKMLLGSYRLGMGLR
jgi:hypothetical protein